MGSGGLLRQAKPAKGGLGMFIETFRMKPVGSQSYTIKPNQQSQPSVV